MRVGERRSVQRMILVAEKGRLASIATLGHMIRPAANDETSVPGHGRNPARFRAFRKPSLQCATAQNAHCPSGGAQGLHGLKAIFNTERFSRNNFVYKCRCP